MSIKTSSIAITSVKTSTTVQISESRELGTTVATIQHHFKGQTVDSCHVSAKYCVINTILTTRDNVKQFLQSQLLPTPTSITKS